MLEIRKGIAAKNYENTFFREFAKNLRELFGKYSIDGLLIGYPYCEVDERLQIDALLITKHVVCIIDFKNFGGKIILPDTPEEFESGKWVDEKGELIKGGSFINPFLQLEKQKSRFIRVVDNHIKTKLPSNDCFNPYHTIKVLCFQKPVELIGAIPQKEELNFFIVDKTNYLETIRDIVDVSDQEVSLSKDSYDIFKSVFKAEQFDPVETSIGTVESIFIEAKLDLETLYPDQRNALKEIESFLKSKDEKIFILEGTSLSGKTYLIPYIRDLAYRIGISEVVILAVSWRVAYNLEKSTNIDFDSIYSYIYDFAHKKTWVKDVRDEEREKDKKRKEEERQEEREEQEEMVIEIVELKKSDNGGDALFIVDEAHLVSDSPYRHFNVKVGSDRLLNDFIKFVDLKETKRKIIFIGDQYQLYWGSKDKSALNSEYLQGRYGVKVRTFTLIDKGDNSPLVQEALRVVNAIRERSFNYLKFDLSNSLRFLTEEEREKRIVDAFNSGKYLPILCYSNHMAQKINLWIKSNILKNGHDLAPGDLVVFYNTFENVAGSKSDPFAKPDKVFNGQFGIVKRVGPIINPQGKPEVKLRFREVDLTLLDTGKNVSVLSFENFRESDNAEFSTEEIIAYKILLRKLAEEELENFKNRRYPVDHELENLLDKLDKGERVKTKVIDKIQEILSEMPGTKYWKYKNVALLRFGWALTVHRATSYKWDEIIFDIETGGGKGNEAYFRWLYTGLMRARHKVNLINYSPITPFYRVNISPVISENLKVEDFFFIADKTNTQIDLDENIIARFKFKNDAFKWALIQLYQFVQSKIGIHNFSVISIRHNDYHEIYEICGKANEKALISIYYNNKAQFKMPRLIKSVPEEFGNKIIDILKAEHHLNDFDFIKDSWRRKAYSKLKEELMENSLSISYIIQNPYKDTIKITRFNDKLIVDMHYDGDGFFTTITALSFTNPDLWEDFKNIIEKLKRGN